MEQKVNNTDLELKDRLVAINRDQSYKRRSYIQFRSYRCGR